MFKIILGTILFFIGLLVISPVDDMLVLAPLSVMYGFWIFPLAFLVGISCLIGGAYLLGKGVKRYLRNPWVLLFFAIAVTFFIFTILEIYGA